MTQQQTLRDFDSLIVSSMISAGMGDVGIYTPHGGGSPVNGISVLVDTVLAEFGDDPGSVAGTKTVLTLYLSEVAVPTRLSTVQIGAKVWKLDSLDAQDESMSRWVVVP